MNYLKYFSDYKYIKNKNDCWSLIQDIYKDEHGIILPEIPVFADENSFVRSNVKHRKVETPKRGIAVHVSTKSFEHIGYAINEKQYIHKTANQGVKISAIPEKAVFYEVFK